MTIVLGQKVQEKVTEFTGITIAEVEYLYGCNQFGVVAKINENGEIKDAEFFDEGRLVFVADDVDATGGIPDWPTDVKLGEEVQDKVTGYRGIVTGRVRHLFGGVRYIVVPKVNGKGDIKSGEIFDQGRIESIGQGITPGEVQGRKNGGPQRDALTGVR